MKNLIVILLFVVSPIIVKGDTVTLRDDSSINGAVRYYSGTFELKGEFKEGEKTVEKIYHLKREHVKAIRINDNRFNPGPPPAGIRQYETSSSLAIPEVKFDTKPEVKPETKKAASEGDSVKLKNNNDLKRGKLTSMDSDKITLENENPFNRDDVIYIRIGRP